MHGRYFWVTKWPVPLLQGSPFVSVRFVSRIFQSALFFPHSSQFDGVRFENMHIYIYIHLRNRVCVCVCMLFVRLCEYSVIARYRRLNEQFTKLQLKRLPTIIHTNTVGNRPIYKNNFVPKPQTFQLLSKKKIRKYFITIVKYDQPRSIFGTIFIVDVYVEFWVRSEEISVFLS